MSFYFKRIYATLIVCTPKIYVNYICIYIYVAFLTKCDFIKNSIKHAIYKNKSKDLCNS